MRPPAEGGRSREAAAAALKGGGVALRVVPNARKTEVTGLHGGAVKLKVASPALEGKANAEVLCFVAEAAGVPVRMAGLVSGDKSRDKVVRVEGMSPDALRLKLLGSTLQGSRL